MPGKPEQPPCWVCEQPADSLLRISPVNYKSYCTPCHIHYVPDAIAVWDYQADKFLPLHAINGYVFNRKRQDG